MNKYKVRVAHQKNGIGIIWPVLDYDVEAKDGNQALEIGIKKSGYSKKDIFNAFVVTENGESVRGKYTYIHHKRIKQQETK